MAIYTQQEIKKIHINLLKNLKEVEIDFSGTGLTALIGINGSGKSTILHALACCYKPLDEEKINYKFSQFFTPTIDSLWQGSRFTMYHDYRVGNKLHKNIETIFSKKTDRWAPKYDRRVARDVFYIGINTGVPKIEEEKRNSFIRYSTTLLDDVTSMTIKEKAGFIMNRDYSSYNLNSDSKGNYYIGVEYNQARYSSLSMSAGEQRIFKILSEVFKAPKNSLILIDEVDLLLHVVALKRLIEVLSKRVEVKKLQIIFTTHSLDILNYSELINIRHLYNTPEKTICLTDTKPDTIFRLTGESTRPIELFVEDDLALTIVNQITESLNMSRYVNVNRFGAAKNCFTTAAGMMLSYKLTTDCLFILDGDEYTSEEDKHERINKALTGTTQENYEMRRNLINHIIEFNLPSGFAPEFFIHSLLKELLIPDQIVEIAKSIQKEDNTHRYVDEIIDRMGYQSKEVGLSKIIDIVSKHDKWADYIAPVKEWLITRKDKLNEDLPNEQALQFI